MSRVLYAVNTPAELFNSLVSEFSWGSTPKMMSDKQHSTRFQLYISLGAWLHVSGSSWQCTLAGIRNALLVWDLWQTGAPMKKRLGELP